ncbi:site-specific integrase [Burkholderia vietnamiensis]|uniref:hypothetical protein n=1 Tax=Burkholderia vietnamiensis TaxID=60552 RepID=UPI001D15E1A9|nr:hypothetical protein [Burkholderia vietnamiensis]UEC05553.1 hypothetical protein LK462_34520 [Burkholderia vietnamiensis]
MTTGITRNPTRADSTREAYEKRYVQLRRRFGRELDRADLAADEVVANLVLLRPELSQRTWRNYKNSVMHYLETYHPENAAAIEELKRWTSHGLRKHSTKTSGIKIKQVPAAALGAIRFALAQRIKRGHKYAAALLSVCEATLLTGLRPNEWMFSELTTHPENGRPILSVRNSKHSNGRANGEFRELYVDGLSEDELEHVRRALTYCECDDDEQAKKLQLALKHEFEAARGVDLSPRRIANSSVTLYSFRHQFVADAKRTFTDPVLTAAACGHSSTKTAHEHYGKRRNSRSGVRVYPTEASVAAVHSRHLELYRDYIAQRGTPRSPTLVR